MRSASCLRLPLRVQDPITIDEEINIGEKKKKKMKKRAIFSTNH